MVAGMRIGILMAGLFYFVLVYALGAIAVVFLLSLFSSVFETEAIQLALRTTGYLLLGLPVYAAVRTAGEQAWRYGTVLGLFEATVVSGLMMLTFSWEGTVHAAVLARMLPVFLAVFALCMAGAGLAAWQNRRERRGLRRVLDVGQ